MIAGWRKYAGGLGIRDYYAIPQWGANRPGSALTVARAREAIPRFHAAGMIMINAEACAAWGSAGLGMYVASRLMWDPAADVDAILPDFYRDCFGKAAPAAQHYFERWDHEKFNPRTLKLALTDLREAMSLADDDGSRKRIAALSLYLHELKLEAAAAAHDPARLESIIAEGDQFVWRVKDIGLLSEGAHFWQLQKQGWPFFTVNEAATILDGDLKDMAGVDVADGHDGRAGLPK